ncbi:MAG TPA: hypothetical protein VF806_03985 [Anaerolineaceae bacterium]
MNGNSASYERSGLTQPLPRAESRLGRLTHLWAGLYFSAFSVVMTWPLVLRMSDAVAGEIGDNIYFIFLIRWYQKAWFQLGISPFFHPWLNYPQGWNLASTDTSLATTLFGLPVSLLFGPTAGYNFAMLVTFVLSGWTMYFWVRRLSGSTAAGLVAGTIYAFLPYHMAHFLIGHMNLSGIEWFPLFFMGLYDLLSAPGGFTLRRDWKPAVLAGVALGLIGFTSMHYLLMTAVISVVFVAAYFLVSGWQMLRDWHFWRDAALKLGGMLLVALPLMLLAALPFFDLNSQGGLATRTASYASMYSASPTDFILPSTQHWLFGHWVGAHFDRSLWIEGTFYIGAVAFALAVVAWLKRRQTRHSLLLKIGLCVIIIAFILSLGTDLHWNNQRVEVPVPAFLQPVVHHAVTPIPLPAYLMFRFVPFYSKMRALMRIGFYVLIFTTLFAGLGAAWLLNHVRPAYRWPLAALLILLVFVDFYPGPYRQFATVSARPVDAWLAQQTGQGAVAQFPASELEDQDQVYNTLVHGKPFIGGFFSANQPSQYQRIRPVLDQFPSPEGVALLRALGVQWVLFDLRQYPDFPPLRKQVEALGLRYVNTIGAQAVFELQ